MNHLIRSLGLGLGINSRRVGEDSICLPQDVPVIGCGPLDEETLLLATDPQCFFDFPHESIAAKLAHQPAPSLLCGLFYVELFAFDLYSMHEFALIGVIRGQKQSRPTNSANKREYEKCDLSMTSNLSDHLEKPYTDELIA